MLYYSNILPRRFPRFYEQFKALCTELKISLREVDGCRDVWLNDFMPLPCEHQNVWFRYNPPQLRNRKDTILKTKQKELVNLPGFEREADSPIRAEPGHFQLYKDHLLVSEKVYRLNNNQLRNPVRQQLLNKTGQGQVVSFPCLPFDRSGHLNNMFQPLGSTFLVSDLNAYRERFTSRVLGKLRKLTAKLVLLPNGYKKEWNDSVTCEGIYTNFLVCGKTVFFPQFNLPQDEFAYQQIKKVAEAGHLHVVAVDMAEIARKGGGLARLFYT